ncbi:MAG TPA: T9SS type A sorting domain-containing protein [Ignavibacteriaceae bacterium]|nr:T9SS type A sorting domain-containing protein [Ignavibacteriaceae bacterium]
MKSLLIIFLVFLSVNLFSQNWPEAIEKWSFPKKVVEGKYPYITPDGKRLYYLYGGYYYIDKTDTGWSAPHLINSNINGFNFKRKIVLTPDEKTLFFTATEDHLIYRSFWNDSINDWGPANLILENGFNSGHLSWHMGNFLNDSTMIVLYGDEVNISYLNENGLWSQPGRYPTNSYYLMASWGCWISPIKNKFYFSEETYSYNRGADIIVDYKTSDSTYGNPHTLNISFIMDSLYKLGEIKGNNESWPYLTADGKTMYFETSYDSGRFTIYESKMLIDENGDTVATGVETSQNGLPNDFYLYPSYPNPFNHSTTISFSLPSSGFTTLKVYDILGNEIVTLVNEDKQPGSYTVEFNASNLSSGVYFYTLTSGSFTMNKKMILMK